MNVVVRLIARNTLLMIALLTALSSTTIYAAPLRPGDIVVPFQSSGNLYKIDPSSGSATLISSGGALRSPMHVLIDAQGRILNADRNGAIVRTDPGAGTQTVLASGSLLTYPTSLAFEPNGDLVVGNSPQLGSPQLIRVDPNTGSQTLLATLTALSSVQDVDVDAQGRIVVLDFGNAGRGRILRYDPATGQQAVVSSGLFNPTDLLIHPDGDFIVANRLANATTQILRIDPVTGAQQLALTVPSEGWIALKDQRTILYADFKNNPAVNPSILSADLLTGQTHPVSNFDVLYNAVGIAIYSPVPEPSTITLLIVGVCAIAGVARCSRTCRSRHVIDLNSSTS